MKSRKVLSLLAVAALTATVFVGCGNKEAKLKDGNYKAESAVDERGYKGSIEIEVKDGKVSEVKYDEVNEEKSTSKLTDADYNKKMKEKSGTNPEEAFPKLQNSLIEKQDASAVDTVSGATSSSNQFKDVAAEALKKAQ